MTEDDLRRRDLELKEREVRALERIADRPSTPVKRTFRDCWYGVPRGQEYRREAYIKNLETVRY